MALSETTVETEQPVVSVVIPAFNEASRIGDSVRKIIAFLDGMPFSSEVIVVDDGSADDTSKIVKQIDSRRLRVIRNGVNHGKGYSVRQGVLNSRGKYVLFTDADLSAPIEELSKLLDVATREGAAIVIGSRAVDRRYIEKHQTRYRELGGIFFNWTVRILLGLHIKDTQCGFKLFQLEPTRTLFEKQTTLGFGFDPELLFVAARRGLTIREVPVRWSHAEGSKLNPIRDGLRMFSDLVRIRWNYIIGKYR